MGSEKPIALSNAAIHFIQEMSLRNNNSFFQQQLLFNTAGEQLICVTDSAIGLQPL